VQADPSQLALLVDLRGHGRSPDFAAPHTLVACAEDLSALAGTLALPVSGIVGHSFGGKVALAYHAQRPDLQRVVLLDSSPSARPDRSGSEETETVLELLARAPARFESRPQFVAHVQREGQSRAIAEWLAMNLSREPDGFRLSRDLALIRALLDDYFARDLWSVVAQSRARIELVVAGRSKVYGEEDLAKARALGPHVRTHVIPEAGHWVHVDAAERVAELLSA